MPLAAIARPTASSLPYEAAVSSERYPAARASIDRLLGLLVGDLEDAEAEDRHLDAVVQRDRLHREGSSGVESSVGLTMFTHKPTT